MFRAIWSWLLIGLGFKIQAQEMKKIQIDENRSIVHIENFKSSYVESRNVDIYIPSDYNDSVSYKVIYMQDGQNLFSPSYAYNQEALHLDEFLIRNKISNLIVVGVWNTEARYREYLPNEMYNALSR
ncbi:MAG: hypothetical protein ABIO44_03845, partial [Saprospiraceae bacterium]